MTDRGVGSRRQAKALRKKEAVSLLREGLSEAEARGRLQHFGPNAIRKKETIQSLSILLSQLRSPLIYILLFAVAITLFLRDFIDAGVIGLAVFINTTLGFYQEYKAQRALVALRELLSPKATVLREGRRVSIEAGGVVPGDICLVGLGERIPADGVVIGEEEFSVTEAILTGESLPVHKNAVKIHSLDGEDIVEVRRKWGGLERDLRVFAGTIVTSGTATIMVVVTGAESEVGKIAETLAETREEATPLQKRIAHISNQIATLVGIITLVLFVLGIVIGNGEGRFLERFRVMFTTAVAVAVAAIPEGLAVSLTVILAIGMQRILKRRALVRRLVAAETLGNVTVICADKTGTLTEGMMRVTKAEFTDRERGVLAAVHSNDRRDPLEIAMWEWVHETQGKDPQHMVEINRRLDAIPFSPKEKFSAKLTERGVYVIGAPEVVLSFSNLSGSATQRWLRKFDEYGYLGYRLVGLAFRERKAGEYRLTTKSIKRGLTWLGILVYEDPIREGVKEALAEARKAGIKVKVITGDYRATAEAVLERLGLLTQREKLASPYPLVIEEEEIEALTVEELRGRVEHAVLFARIDPVQKLKIVEALQANGEVVAMTGDGVNDAPALKRADIGIVVSGASDVSKETADIVLLDDNFSTIVAAVEEGRGIFENIRKVILYLLSDSFSEVILVLGSILLRVPLPLTAAQILWINLITDGFPNLALTVEPKDGDLMRQKPRDRREPLVDDEIKLLVVLISAVTGIATLLAFLWFWQYYGDAESARSVVFVMLGVDSLIYVFSARSLRRPIWRTPLLSNPWLLLAVIGGFFLQLGALYLPFLRMVLETRSLTPVEWIVVLVEVVLVIGIIELVKWKFLEHKRRERRLAEAVG